MLPAREHNTIIKISLSHNLEVLLYDFVGSTNSHLNLKIEVQSVCFDLTRYT